MALSYVNSPEKDFSSGIDARSAENQIEPGFVKDLLNADIVEKRARKRPGYQGFAGNIPIRVTQMEYKNTENLVCFTLDSAVSLGSTISLEAVRSSPIVVYGRSSLFTTGQGPFIDTADNAKYYPKFSIPLRKTLTAGTGTLLIEGTEHGLGTTDMFVSIVESLSTVTRDYQDVLVDSIEIDGTSFDISIDYTVATTTEVFVYFADKTAVVGSTYIATLNHTGSGSETFTITAGTHALSNFNIVPQFQLDDGAGNVERIIPDEFTIATSGDVTVTINSSSAETFYALLSAAPIANQATGVVSAMSTGTVTISAPEKPWIFPGIYLEQTPGGTKELVLPDTIDFDDTNNEVTLTFVNGNTTARNFIVFYDYGDIRSNQLCVEDSSVTVDGIDEVPQITIWGLDHSEIYAEKANREGWVNHVDSYRRSGEQRLISGLGGNLFSARTYSEAASTYLYPRLYPNLLARTNSSRVLGPLFWDTGETPARTRGYITSDSSGTHWATITSVAYNTGTGYTDLTISLPNKLVLDSSGTPTTLSSVISTTASLEDWLTVTNMSYSRHNGTFRIMQVADGVNSITLSVDISDNSADYDDANVGGQAGVFTDQFVWSSTSPFIPEDILSAELLSDTIVCTVLSSSGSTTVSDGMIGSLEVPGGVLFNAARTSAVVPMRSGAPSSVASTTNLVRGDMLSYSGIPRLLRVLAVNSDADRTVNITADGTLATVTMTAGDTSYIAEGMSILLLNAGVYTGTVTISEILTSTTFTFETSETTSVTGATLAGETAVVDEELAWEDTPSDANLFTCEKRWIPLEAPDDSFDQTPSTHVRYFDVNQYSDQPFLRSTMVVDNMYFTNSDDEIYKLDGDNIYRAGIIPWQPGLFLTQETSGAEIVINNRSLAYSASTAALGRLTIAAGDAQTLPVGASVRLSGSTKTYTIRDYIDDGTNYYVLVDRSLDSSVSASGTLSEIATFRYYFRLNAVDANDNIIASATTGYQDHVVELTENAAVQIRLTGLPAWDVYDYDRLEVQIYRTKQSQSAPFYLVTTLAMSFDNGNGYIDYTDSFADSDLTQLDVVNTALKGTELGTSWSDPVRAKFVTSIGNKLVLGNLRDYPQLDFQVVGDATLADASFAGDNLLFRKANTDAGTTSNMTDRVRYEWVSNSGAVTIVPTTDIVGTAGVSFTVDSTAHGLVAGDWVYLYYATVATTARPLKYCGWWQIASVTTDTFTIRYEGATALSPAAGPDTYVTATAPEDVPVLLGTDGNLGMVNGDSFDTFDAMRRMSMAINASMRQTDTVLNTSFTPWLTARGGNDLTPAGRLVVRQPRADDSTMEVLVTFSGYALFVNSTKRATGDQVSASTRVSPSRILVSYENYPEIFDNPSAILDTESDSAVDINSADGQEITGVIPFFGEAAFGAAQQSAILVVFKTNSIYLVDLNEKAQGRDPVQRIETEGLGCTAPYSIAVTKNGIMFANESGIYCLRRNQAIQYIGRFMERNWVERVDIDALSIAQGHHYGVGRLYKLSVPIVNGDSEESASYIENSEAYVYNHTSEAEGKPGAWTRYSNHPATGWANLNSDAFFSSTNGRVFSIRRTGLLSDFRDDNEAIEFLLDTRPNDFGNSGIRKVVDKQIIHYRAGARNTGTAVLYALDLEEEYESTSPVIIPRGTTGTGIDDTISQLIVTVSHSVQRRRAVYFSTRITNSTIDENVEIAGIDYRVGGLQERGILQAAQTEE